MQRHQGTASKELIRLLPILLTLQAMLLPAVEAAAAAHLLKPRAVPNVATAAVSTELPPPAAAQVPTGRPTKIEARMPTHTKIWL